MKKTDIAPIQEDREELSKLTDSIHKVTYLQKQLSSQSLSGDEELGKLIDIKIENIQRVKKILKSFTDRLKNSNIHYLAFFVGTEALDNIADSIFQIFQQRNGLITDPKMRATFEDNSKQLAELIMAVIKFANYHAPQLLANFCRNYPQLEKLVQDIKDQGEEYSETEKRKTKQKQSSIEEFKSILAKVIEVKADRKKFNNSSINQIFKMVLKHESRDERGDDVYEEIALNWIKFQLEEFRKDKQFLCCKTIFFKDEMFQYYRKKHFQLKTFTKIIDNTKIGEEQLELSQTIAAFMNSKGGVIFLGITHEQNKFPIVVGFELEQKYKKDIVKFIRNAVNQVLPKHKCFEMCTEQSQHYYNSAYELNYYVSIEFMNVVKKGTFENCRDPLRSYQKLYICKIAVKMGHPRYLYYVLKNEGNKDNKKQAQIQFFIRGQESNQKETLDKNYDLIYKKLADYAASKESLTFDEKERIKIHEGCLYDMTMRSEVFQLEDPDVEDD